MIWPYAGEGTLLHDDPDGRRTVTTTVTKSSTAEPSRTETVATPERVFLPHTYQARDFAPALAARVGRPLVTDCVAVKDGGYVRPMFQGKLQADISVDGPHIATFQIGAYRADAMEALAPRQHGEIRRRVVDTLAEYCPGLKESILYRQVLTPWDLEQEFGHRREFLRQPESKPERCIGIA